MTEKTVNALATIHRAMGIIEGVACGVEKAAADALIDAVEMIDSALKEVL